MILSGRRRRTTILPMFGTTTAPADVTVNGNSCTTTTVTGLNTTVSLTTVRLTTHILKLSLLVVLRTSLFLCTTRRKVRAPLVASEVRTSRRTIRRTSTVFLTIPSVRVVMSPRSINQTLISASKSLLIQRLLTRFLAIDFLG